jgi:hypothetical protein
MRNIKYIKLTYLRLTNPAFFSLRRHLSLPSYMANDKPKRAATNSAQAKHAAAIAAAEAREDVAQQKKPRGRPKKVPVQQQVPALAPTVEPEDPEDPEAGDTDEGILIECALLLASSYPCILTLSAKLDPRTYLEFDHCY